MSEKSNEQSLDRDALKRLIGSRIKAARVRAGLTQQELLERMRHKTIESISNVERGSTLPPLDTLLDFAQALKVDPGLLLTVDRSMITLSSVELSGVSRRIRAARSSATIRGTLTCAFE